MPVGRGQARNFFRATTNAVFGKIGRVASEEVVLELVKCKLFANFLLYGLECCPLNKSDVKSLDFAVTRFLMTLFKSVNLNLINECRLFQLFATYIIIIIIIIKNIYKASI